MQQKGQGEQEETDGIYLCKNGDKSMNANKRSGMLKN